MAQSYIVRDRGRLLPYRIWYSGTAATQLLYLQLRMRKIKCIAELDSQGNVLP